LGERSSAPKKNYVPDDVVFQTKPQIALDMIRHALTNDIVVNAWTFDEFYGRDSKFLDGLEALEQNFVAEIPGSSDSCVRWG
jgi:SRSO17 transposase